MGLDIIFTKKTNSNGGLTISAKSLAMLLIMSITNLMGVIDQSNYLIQLQVSFYLLRIALMYF